MLAELGGIQNPYFDKRQVVGFNKAYLGWRTASLYRRMMGEKYQRHGATDRGAAAPRLGQDGSTAAAGTQRVHASDPAE